MPYISIKHKFIILVTPTCDHNNLKKTFLKYQDCSGVQFHRYANAFLVKSYIENKKKLKWDHFTTISIIREPFERFLLNEKNGKHFKKTQHINDDIKNNKIPFLYNFETFHCDNSGNLLVDYIVKLSELYKINNILKFEDKTRKKGIPLYKQIQKYNDKTDYTQIINEITDENKKILRKVFKYDFSFYEDNLFCFKNSKLKILK